MKSQINFHGSLGFAWLTALGLATAAAGNPSPYFRTHQIVVGGGDGGTFEKDIFNTRASGTSDAAQTDPAMRIGYNFNLNDRWAIGVLMHGYAHEFSEYVTTSDGEVKVDFKLNTYNRGITVQHYFSRGRVQPYVYGIAGLATGTITAKADGQDESDLDYDGFSFGGGGGALLVVAKYFGISVDGVVSLGSAEWEEQPFTNSSGKDFTPSYWALTFNLVALIP